jgi:hypothetical protein
MSADFSSLTLTQHLFVNARTGQAEVAPEI